MSRIASRRIAPAGSRLRAWSDRSALGDGSRGRERRKSSTASPRWCAIAGRSALAWASPIRSSSPPRHPAGVRAIWCERPYESLAPRGPGRALPRALPDGGSHRCELPAGPPAGPLVVRHEDGRPWLPQRLTRTRRRDRPARASSIPPVGCGSKASSQTAWRHERRRSAIFQRRSLESEIDFGPGGNDSAPPSDLHPATPASARSDPAAGEPRGPRLLASRVRPTAPTRRRLSRPSGVIRSVRITGVKSPGRLVGCPARRLSAMDSPRDESAVTGKRRNVARAGLRADP